MAIHELKIDELVEVYNIIIPADEINSAVETKIKELTQKVTMPGFRAGKVPASVVKKQYFGQTFMDIADAKIKEAVSELLKSSKKQNLIIAPEITDLVLEEGKDLSFKVTLEFAPVVELPDVTQFKIDLMEVVPSQDAVERVRSALLSSRSTKEDVLDLGYLAQTGDEVKIDFKGFIGEEQFEGGTSNKQFDLVIGSKMMIPGFEDQIIGHKKDEVFDIFVTFPEEYGAENLAGKEAKFEITIHQISKLILPEITKDFVGSLGYENIEDFEQNIVKHASESFKPQEELLFKIRLFSEIEKAVNFSLPQRLVDIEMKLLQEQLQSASDDSESDSMTEEEILRVANRRVKVGLVVKEYATKEKINVSDNELGTAVMSATRGHNFQSRAEFQTFCEQNRELIQKIHDYILESKVVESMLFKCQPNCVITKISPEDFELLIEKEVENVVL